MEKKPNLFRRFGKRTTVNNDEEKQGSPVPSPDASSEKAETEPQKQLQDAAPEDKPAEASAGQGAQEEEFITGFKLAIVLVAVTLVAFLMLLDTSIVATAIPRITSDFHALNDVGWYGAAYLLASASLQPLTGKLYSLLNNKWTFLTFVGIFELGSLLCGVAVNSKMFIVGRAVAGLGASGVFNGALTILASCLPIHKRPLYLGIMISTAQIGLVCGPLVGGVLTEKVTWRWCFYINLPCGGAVALLLFLISIPSKIPKLDKKNRFMTVLKKLDLVGFALFAPAAIQCLLALEWGGTKYAWGSSKIIGLFCGAFGTFVVFCVWDWYKGEEAMIPLSAARVRIVWSSCLVMFFFFGALMLTVYYLPIYFQAVKGVSPITSGVWLLPTILPQMLMATISGILVGRLGYYLPWVVNAGVLMSIGTGLFSTFTPETSTGRWVGFQVLASIGRGGGMQMPIVAIQNVLPANMISIGMALLVFSQTFGGALFLALGETDFTSSLVKALKQYAPEVSAEEVILAGATAVRDVVPKDQLPGVLLAYNNGTTHAFYLTAAASACVFVFAWGMGWKSVKKVKKPANPSPAETNTETKTETKTLEKVATATTATNANASVEAAAPATAVTEAGVGEGDKVKQEAMGVGVADEVKKEDV